MKIDSQSSSPPVFIIAGPTSVGKSALALELARPLRAEIVGVDAFQLYRGLPILTAQISTQEIPHHLIGTLDPTEECDAMRYRSMVIPVIEETVARGKLPLLVGGTGFYLRSLLSPLDPLPPADHDLRKKMSTLSDQELLSELTQLDPKAPTQIDTNNRRRIERVLELLTLTKKPLSEIWKKENSPTLPHRGIFLVRDREDLHQRIEKSVREMFEHGVLEEVASLGPIGRTAAMTLGLREIQAHLRGELSLASTIETIIQKTKRYAKRQITWFRNQHHFFELNLSLFSSLESAAEKAYDLLRNEEKR